MALKNQTTDQCSLCERGACHDDACPHGLPRKETPEEEYAAYSVAIRAEARRALAEFRLEYAFTLQPGHRAVSGPAIASGDISNDDVQAVPFGEGKR